MGAWAGHLFLHKNSVWGLSTLQQSALIQLSMSVHIQLRLTLFWDGHCLPLYTQTTLQHWMPWLGCWWRVQQSVISMLSCRSLWANRNLNVHLCLWDMPEDIPPSALPVLYHWPEPQSGMYSLLCCCCRCGCCCCGCCCCCCCGCVWQGSLWVHTCTCTYSAVTSHTSTVVNGSCDVVMMLD